MGIAIGNIGMLYDEFMWLDFGEFHCIYDAWRKRKEEDEQAEWERMRMLATICISPHVKHAPTPQRLLPFPWENRKKKADVPKVGKEEAKKRLERLMGKGQKPR